MSNVEMYVGDLEPDLMVQLTSNNLPLITSEVATAHVLGYLNGELLFTNSADIDDDGTVTMTWNGTDTDQVGTLRFKVRLTWPDSRPQTVEVDDVVKVYSL